MPSERTRALYVRMLSDPEDWEDYRCYAAVMGDGSLTFLAGFRYPTYWKRYYDHLLPGEVRRLAKFLGERYPEEIESEASDANGGRFITPASGVSSISTVVGMPVRQISGIS